MIIIAMARAASPEKPLHFTKRGEPQNWRWKNFRNK